jgi:hypothetical protein
MFYGRDGVILCGAHAGHPAVSEAHARTGARFDHPEGYLCPACAARIGGPRENAKS